MLSGLGAGSTEYWRGMPLVGCRCVIEVKDGVKDSKGRLRFERVDGKVAGIGEVAYKDRSRSVLTAMASSAWSDFLA